MATLAKLAAGWFSDRVGRRGLLAIGYLIGVLTAAGLVATFVWRLATVPCLLGLFAVGGLYLAFEEALEGTITADLVVSEVRGTAYGLLGAANGVGDVAASTTMGALWTMISPAAAFGYAAVVMLIGTGLVFRVR